MLAVPREKTLCINIAFSLNQQLHTSVPPPNNLIHSSEAPRCTIAYLPPSDIFFLFLFFSISFFYQVGSKITKKKKINASADRLELPKTPLFHLKFRLTVQDHIYFLLQTSALPSAMDYAVVAFQPFHCNKTIYDLYFSRKCF